MTTKRRVGRNGGRPITQPDNFVRMLQRARYAVLKAAGADSIAAREGATGGPRFAAALTRLGGDPSRHPELMKPRRGGSPAWARKTKPEALRPAPAPSDTPPSEDDP